MHLLYEPSAHSLLRCNERSISDQEIAAALGRGRVEIFDYCGIARFYDWRSSVTVIVNVQRRIIVTAWKNWS